MLFIGMTSYAQGEKFFLDFEGTEPLNNLPTGVTNVNGSETVLVKGSDSYPAQNNEVQADPDAAGESELFLDFHGYLKIDIDDTSNGYSLAYDYRRNDDNDDWWLGFLTFIGNDGVENRLEQLLIREWDGQLNFKDTNTGSNKPIGFFTNYHVVVVVNADGDLMVYVDGSEVLNVPNSSSNYNLDTWTNASLLMSFKGNSFDGSTVTPEPEYDTDARDARVFVDNIALFERALSASEVTTLLNDGNNTLSVDDQIVNRNLNVYPNPVRDVLNFSSSDVKSVEVYNLLGSKVMSQKTSNSSLNVSHLNTGTYIINCLDADGKNLKTVKTIKL